MSTRNVYLLFVCTLFLVSCVSCTAPEVQKDSLVLVNGTLIDGTGANPLSDAVVVIQDERIVAVGPQDQVKIPRGARVLDVGGNTILPGFINAHVHFGFNEQHLQSWARGGVTTVRDEAVVSSGGLHKLMKQRDELNQNPQNAHLISAGYMISVPDGYGDLFVASAEDAQQKVLEEFEAGVDLIKISMEDGYAGRSNLPKLTDSEIAAIIKAAHERGKRVSGHITQAEYLKILVAAGVDDIAHVPYDSVPTETWQEMVAKDIYMTPTFTVYRNYHAPIATCVRNLHNFLEQGGQVALGNDYGGGPGEFELGIPMYEIEQMSAAGMTPMQIIVASTKNAAHVSGVEDQVGTLEVSKLADVLIISGDPLVDLQTLRNISMVIHNGMLIREEDQ